MLNLVVIQGNLGRDPEVKYTESGMCVCELSIAITEGKDKPPTWVRVTAFEKTAETITQHFKKGSQIIIEGRLKTDTWDDKDTGKKRSKTYVIANRVQFCGSKSDNATPAQQAQSNQSVQPVATSQPAANLNEIPF